MMLRIAVSSPPGVSICSTTSCACSLRRALERALDVVGGGRADGAVDAQHEDRCHTRIPGAAHNGRRRQQRQREKQPCAVPHVSLRHPFSLRGGSRPSR